MGEQLLMEWSEEERELRISQNRKLHLAQGPDT